MFVWVVDKFFYRRFGGGAFNDSTFHLAFMAVMRSFILAMVLALAGVCGSGCHTFGAAGVPGAV